MDSFLISALTMIAYQLPDLLATIFALLLFFVWTPAAPGRPLARTGAGLMLAAALLRVGLTCAQAWMIQRSAVEGVESMGRIMGVFGALSMLLTLVAVAGLILVVLGARKAMIGRAVP